MEDQASNDKTSTAGHSVSLRTKLYNFLNKYALLILAILLLVVLPSFLSMFRLGLAAK